MSSQQIRIQLTAYDHRVLDRATKEIVSAVNRAGDRVIGPIPLPNRREVFTVNRSPHIDKKSREAFARKSRKRIIYIEAPNRQTIDLLSKVELPAGVDVQIKIMGAK